MLAQPSALEWRRILSLEAALSASGLLGDPVDFLTRADENVIVPHFRESATAEQRAQADDLIGGWDWTEAGELGANREAAVQAAVSAADATAIGTRALASVSATRDNDQAEAFAALLDLLGITPEQVVARVSDRREASPPPLGAPPPSDVVASATTRLDGAAVLGLVVGYIQAGVGDPITV